MKTRVQNPEDYITATLKLEPQMILDFTDALQGQSKNSYIKMTMERLDKVFADDRKAKEYVYDSIQYTTARKKMYDDSEKHKLKNKVVSVKLEKALYNSVMNRASQYGLTFSELIRREIIKKIES